MKTNLDNTESYLLKYDKEIEKEQKEIKKLEELINNFKLGVEKNTKMGEQLLSEMHAIDEERKSNKEKLDSRRADFT